MSVPNHTARPTAGRTGHVVPVGAGHAGATAPSPAPAAPPSARRITIVTSATAWGGAELQAAALARTLAARGHRVTLLELGGRWYEAASRAAPEVRVVHVPGPRLRDCSLRQALRALAPHRGDVCVVSKPSFGERSLAVDAAARLLFRRCVRWEHHPAPPHDGRPRRSPAHRVPRPGLRWQLARLGLRLHGAAAHRVITVSEVVRRRLVAIPGYDPAVTQRVHCGVDTTTFAPSAERRARARAAFGLAPDDVVVGAVGRVAENKRFDVALRSLQALAHARPTRSIRWLLAGDGPEAAALQAMAHELGLADRARFLGAVPQAADALCAIDVFVMPSRLEGLGVALLEAMACGCACVAMDSGGPAEVLTDPSLGWLVPADDVPAFTAALAAAVDEPEEARRHRGRLARAHVERHFAADRQLDLLATAVEQA